MKIFLFLVVSIFFFQHIHAQDSLGNIMELEKLLKERKVRFDAYAESADHRSGIFGTKTKKDLEQSREILLQIVKTDNQLLNALDQAIVKRGMAKADYSFDELGYKQTVDRLTAATDTLNKQLITTRELNATLESKAQTQQWILYLFGGIIVLLMFLMLVKRK